jgi:hypothetical protein
MLVSEKAVGSLVAINRAIGLDARDSTLSQIKTGSIDKRKNEPKVMGSTLARKIESSLGKPVGWMDTDPDLEWPFETVSPQLFRGLSERKKGMVEAAVLRAIADLDAGDEGPARLSRADPGQPLQPAAVGAVAAVIAAMSPTEEPPAVVDDLEVLPPLPEVRPRSFRPPPLPEAAPAAHRPRAKARSEP